MKILVTGSAGQLGGAIAAQLKQHHEVIGIDLLPSRWTTHVGSVCDRELMLRCANGCQAIVHTASLHAPHLSSSTREHFVRTNKCGTLNLLEAALENGIARFIYTSTTSVYGHAMELTDEAVWVDEDLIPDPRDIYDITKVNAEQLCRDVARTTKGMSCVSLRVSRFFLETQKDNGHLSTVPWHRCERCRNSPSAGFGSKGRRLRGVQHISELAVRAFGYIRPIEKRWKDD